jgi:hypothetical protein
MSELFDPAILPTPQEIVGPAKDRLVAVRPTADGHVDRGAYAIGLFTLRFRRVQALGAAAF